MRIALDTNILAYAEGVNGAARAEAALSMLARLAEIETIVPAQVLGELYAVLVRKAGRSPQETRNAILQWRDAFNVVETSSETLLRAADLAAEHHLSIWDALIVCVASGSGCRLLLSEDMQDGFTWGGTTVVNPFATEPNPLYLAILSS